MSRWKATTRLLVRLLACLAAMAGLVRLGIEAVQGEPYRMTLKPADGHAVVQFYRPDEGVHSAEFPVDLVVDSPWVITLRSGDISVPGCTIESYDTTLLPGRFEIRVGHTPFDVMERAIIVEGKEHEWRDG